MSEGSRLDTFLSEEVIEALIVQYKKELVNAQVYLSFSAWAGIKGYPGAEKWFKKAYEEEQTHALEIHKFLKDAGIFFTIDVLNIEDVEIKDCVDLYHQALVLETYTTDGLNKLMKICGKDDQFIAQEFVNKLLYVQLEEEQEARQRFLIVQNATDPMVADHIIFDL